MTSPRREDPRRALRRARRRTWWATAPGWCTLAGILIFLSFPNWNLYPLAFVALAPLVLVSERLSVRGAFFAGWWTGAVTNAGGFYWLVGMMVDFANSPVIVGLGVLLLCALQQGLVYGLAAAIARDARMIRLLVARGADVDARGRDGWTPLGLAARTGAVDIAKALLEARADVHAVSGNGRTPIEIATINRKHGLLELMQGQARPS